MKDWGSRRERRHGGPNGWRRGRAGVLLLGLSLVLLGGFTTFGEQPFHEGVPLPSEAVATIQTAITKLQQAGYASAATQLTALLSGGDICWENGPAAKGKLGAEKDGKVNIQGALLVAADADANQAGGVFAGEMTILCGTLIHEVGHVNGQNEITAHWAELDALNLLVGSLADAGSVKRVCQRIRKLQEFLRQKFQAAGEVDYVVPPSPVCDEFDQSAPGDAPFIPASVVPYVPLGSPSYWRTLAIKDLLDGIEIPPEYQALWIESYGDTAGSPTYVVLPVSGDLWIDRWNPHAAMGMGGWERVAVSLGFKPLALARRDDEHVVIAGRSDSGECVVREYAFDLSGARISMTLLGLYSGPALGYVTGLAVAPTPHQALVLLDADGMRLWWLDEPSGQPTLLADAVGVPELVGRRSLHVAGWAPGSAGLTYHLESSLPDLDDVADGPAGALEITDLAPGDGVIDGYQVFP